MATKDPSQPGTAARSRRAVVAVLIGVLVLLGLLAVVIVSRQTATTEEAKVAELLSKVRKGERNEKPLFMKLENLRQWPQPFPSVAKLILGDDFLWVNSSEFEEIGEGAIPPLMQALERDRSPAVRTMAIEALAELQALEAVSLITNALVQDPNTEVRQAAANVFSWQLEDPRAEGALAYALGNDASHEVRRSSASALADLSGTNSTDALVQAMQTDTNSEVCEAAAYALGTIGDPIAYEPLLAAALRSLQSGLRVAAVAALGSLGNTNATAVLLRMLEQDELAEVRGAAAGSLATLGGNSVAAPLVKALEMETTGSVRTEIVSALARFSDPGARRALMQSLADDPDPNVRQTAAFSIRFPSAEWALPALINALGHDANSEVRAAAAMTLASVGGPDITEALMETLRNDSDSAVRREAASGLGRAQAEEAVALLATVVTAPEADDSVRSSAAAALGELGLIEGLPALVEVLQAVPEKARPAVNPKIDSSTGLPTGAWLTGGLSRHDRLAQEAAESIQAILAHQRWARLAGALDPDQEEILKDVQAALLSLVAGEGADPVRAAAVKALGHCQGSEVVEVLSLCLTNDSSPELQGAAIEALGQLRDPTTLVLLTNTHAFLDEHLSAAADALGAFGVPEAAPALLSLLRSKNDEVRVSAARALGYAGSAEAVSPLITLIEQERKGWVRAACAEALGFLGDARAVPALATALSDRSSEVRQEAAWALGHIGDTSAVPALVMALADRESQVRFIATFALAELRDPTAVPAIESGLGDKDAMVRLASAAALMFFANDQGQEIIETALNEEDSWQRFTAVMALIRRGSPESARLLAATRQTTATPLGRLIQRAVQTQGVSALHDSLSEPDQNIRLWTAKALVLLNDPTSLDSLHRATQDPDAQVSQAALLGVRRIQR